MRRPCAAERVKNVASALKAVGISKSGASRTCHKLTAFKGSALALMCQANSCVSSSVLDACSVELLAEASIHCSDISCNRAMPATQCRKMLWPTCCSCAAAAKAGVYAINCPEWMLVLQACNRSSVYCGESASTWQPIQLLRPVANSTEGSVLQTAAAHLWDAQTSCGLCRVMRASSLRRNPKGVRPELVWMCC